MRTARERLEDILQGIDAVARYATRGRAAYDEEELIPVWMARHIQIIGEAARTLPDDVRRQAPEVPWVQVVGMRHMLVHSYHDIDPDEVWNTATIDLPALRPVIERLIAWVDATAGGHA